MTDYRPPLDDIRFVLDEVTDYGRLAGLDTFSHADLDTVSGVLEEAGRFMAEVVAPTNVDGDRQGATRNDDGTVGLPASFADAYGRYVEAGWGAVAFPPSYGGGGFPWAVGIALQEMLTSANMAFSLCPLLTQGAIDALLHHGTEAQRELYLPRMTTGEWSGTMNLTEPEAGSDVGALTTRAERRDDGSYRITGQKIYITFGEHDLTPQIVHLVLARLPDAPPGTRGISLFVVPKFLLDEDGEPGERNDVTCVSIEHKLGIHGSPTCVLSFGDGGEGAVGYLVGEENQGMRCMFTMMNNARLSVGLSGLAIGERAFRQAAEFAQERQQGRAVGAPAGTSSPIIDHADVRRMLMTMKAQVEGLRCLIYANAAAIDLAANHPDPAVRERNDELAAIYTPVSKAFGTDLGVEVASTAMQVHGGMGYVEETGVAQYYRDIRIAPIYEGTNGIQAADLVGRKLALRGGAAVKELLAEIAGLDTDLAAAGDDLAAIRAGLADAVEALGSATDWMLAHGAEDPNAALAGSAPYLRMFGLTLCGSMLARSALAASKRLGDGRGDASFNRAKIVTARFHATRLLPEVRALASAATSGASDLFALTPEQL
ncbi:MAG: acyl-CoA dehydrogenase [Actinomycetota bacterium]|nr:acyl-CoA dehydrogenase [Actinomycetota bacterium]